MSVTCLSTDVADVYVFAEICPRGFWNNNALPFAQHPVLNIQLILKGSVLPHCQWDVLLEVRPLAEDHRF